eukprot:7391072-Prymnesium_polylepis.2
MGQFPPQFLAVTVTFDTVYSRYVVPPLSSAQSGWWSKNPSPGPAHDVSPATKFCLEPSQDQPAMSMGHVSVSNGN